MLHMFQCMCMCLCWCGIRSMAQTRCLCHAKGQNKACLSCAGMLVLMWMLVWASIMHSQQPAAISHSLVSSQICNPPNIFITDTSHHITSHPIRSHIYIWVYLYDGTVRKEWSAVFADVDVC